MSALPEPGDRVECVAMSDPHPVPKGTKGTVKRVSNTPWGAQISVAWDNGSSLALLDGEDVWRVVSHG